MVDARAEDTDLEDGYGHAADGCRDGWFEIQPLELAALFRTLHVLLIVAALQQFVSNVRHHRFITRAFGKVIRTIKVRPQSNVVDARDLHDVIDVID